MKVLKYPHEMLKIKCEEVLKFDKTLDYYLEEMSKSMILNGGIGLSANQIGINARMFVMLPTYAYVPHSMGIHLELINPEIIESSGEADLLEGCLSLPGKMIKIKNRASYVKVAYQDREGKSQTIELKDIDAVCVQHEIDHLNGIFFLERESKWKNYYLAYWFVYFRFFQMAVIDSGAPVSGVDKICETHDITNSPTHKDKIGHGTNVSRLIDKYAGDSNYCQIPIKLFHLNGSGYVKANDALVLAIKLNVDVINYSGGGDDFNKRECKLVKKALNKGIKIVASAGNRGQNISIHPYYPASCDKRVIVVGCSNLEKSNYGPVDYTLPCKNEGNPPQTGTSQATAKVTGILVKGLNKVREKENESRENKSGK